MSGLIFLLHSAPDLGESDFVEPIAFLIPRPIREKCLSLDILDGYRSPDSTVAASIPVIAHCEDVSWRHCIRPRSIADGVLWTPR